MQSPAPSPTVLVVDDDEGLLVLIAFALQEHGWEVVTARSGAEAEVRLQEANPDLMVLDLKLKDVSGLDLVERLKQAGKTTPFIVITGQGDERVAVEMMKQGARDYLIKDTGMLDLIPTVVRQTLEQIQRDRELVAAQVALRESQAQVLAISEREQMRIGAELHDGLGQQLTAIELMCESLKEDLPSGQRALAKQVSSIGRHLREAIAQTRSLARGLSPVNVGAEGLVEALGGLARSTKDVKKVQCTFECPQPVAVEDNAVALHLFRIAQEAVNNALKHAQATEVKICLSNNESAVRLVVNDNGKGMTGTGKTAGGIGLQVMKHRASVIGADLQINSQPGKGLTVSCTIPGEKR